LDYFSKNVLLIKFSDEKSKAVTLMLPKNGCQETQPISLGKTALILDVRGMGRFFIGGAIATVE
jgi:hypothetical protein